MHWIQFYLLYFKMAEINIIYNEERRLTMWVKALVKRWYKSWEKSVCQLCLSISGANSFEDIFETVGNYQFFCICLSEVITHLAHLFLPIVNLCYPAILDLTDTTAAECFQAVLRFFKRNLITRLIFYMVGFFIAAKILGDNYGQTNHWIILNIVRLDVNCAVACNNLIYSAAIPTCCTETQGNSKQPFWAVIITQILLVHVKCYNIQ